MKDSRSGTGLSACLLLLLFASASPVHSQILLTESASVWNFFPQIAQGSSGGVTWQTTFTFTNPNALEAATGTLTIADDNGNLLALNLGSGAAAQHPVSIPPLGSVTLRGTPGFAPLVVGWAIANFDGPVQGVATYGLSVAGLKRFELSVPSTLPTTDYFSAATSRLGIALANFDPSPITLIVVANGNNGFVYDTTVALPEFSHRALALNELLPEVGANFEGTVLFRHESRRFLALTLRSDDGLVYSSLPSGASALPRPHEYEIQTVFARIQSAARYLAPEFGGFPNLESVSLQLSEDPQVNAYASGVTVRINLALAELIADSPSELAFVVGHEIGHVYQNQTGKYLFEPLNSERDADIWGFFLALQAGYDPYGSAGTLAKLAMATGNAALTSQWEALFASAAHGSFNDRLDNIYDTIQEVCALPEGAPLCAQFRENRHPHLPGVLALPAPTFPPISQE